MFILDLDSKAAVNRRILRPSLVGLSIALMLLLSTIAFGQRQEQTDKPNLIIGELEDTSRKVKPKFVVGEVFRTFGLCINTAKYDLRQGAVKGLAVTFYGRNVEGVNYALTVREDGVSVYRGTKDAVVQPPAPLKYFDIDNPPHLVSVFDTFMSQQKPFFFDSKIIRVERKEDGMLVTAELHNVIVASNASCD